MKTVRMDRDFTYRAKHRVFIKYKAGHTYKRVPEAAVKVIKEYGAGRVVDYEEVSE